MPMDPVTTNATVVSAPAPAAPVPTPPPSAPAPAAVPVVTPVADSPELAQIRADRARLEAEVAQLKPWAQKAYQATLTNPVVPPVVPVVAPKVNVLGVRELDPNVQAFLTTDAAGNVVATPDAPPGVVAQYQAHQRELGIALKKLATNPEEALAAVINKAKEDWLKEAKTELTSEQQKAQHAAQAERIVQVNSEWLFEKDAAGNRVTVVDPLTGQATYKRTEGGDWWASAANKLMQAGVSDPVMVDEYARAHAFFQAYQKSQAAQPVAPPVAPVVTPTAQDLKTAFLNKIPGAAPGSVQPNRTSPTPDGRKLTLQESMLQQLTLAGYSPGSKLPQGIPQAA